MDISTDIEVKTLRDMLNQGMWQPSEVDRIERALADRKAAVEAGCRGPDQEYWSALLRELVDPLLRLRFELMRDWGWVVDRWIEEWQCWAPVAVLGPGIRQDLIEYLKANDLQRIGPEKRLQEKRDAAGKVRAENERLANERVLEAIDGLSARQIKEFIQVERAVQTGETVIMHGETRKSFDRMVEAGKKAPPEPENAAMNPGANPLVYRHIAEREPNGS